MKTFLVTPTLADMLALDFPGVELKSDSELLLYDSFVPLVQNGQKTTTVRYAKGRIRMPSSGVLPLFESKADDKNHKRHVGQLEIAAMDVKSFAELTDADGRNDGFSGRAELVGVIEKIYGQVTQGELVSVYHVKLL